MDKPKNSKPQKIDFPCEGGCRKSAILREGLYVSYTCPKCYSEKE